MAKEAEAKAELVRQALAELGEAPPQELAAFIERRFGVKMQPAIIQVIRASWREREHLQKVKQAALEAREQARANEANEARPAGKRKPKPAE